MEAKNKFYISGKTIVTFIIIVILVTVAVVLAIVSGNKPEEPKKEIITEAMLEEVINVSELSTFEAVYNGVAKVYNKQKPINIDYYVSYCSKIKAGIDFEQVGISVDNEAKKITATLPEVTITDVTVDITTLDYIFQNAAANNASVSEEAYKACIEDATVESRRQKDIYSFAQQNAENVIKALINPFVSQLDEEYTLEIILPEVEE
ncbi:MAG: DUF4230 domain-containing protein [Ruminococcaceae bacterium]|nr:DUF4230 domain-containing protein [Oscillospiraceae bacterium]